MLHDDFDDENTEASRRPLQPDQVLHFLLAGNALLTLVSKKTGQHFSYHVKSKRDDKGNWLHAEPFRFVSLHRHGNRPAPFATITFQDGPGACEVWCKINARPHVEPTHDAVRGFVWLCHNALNGPNNVWDLVEVWHEGRCGRCGRALRDPESCARGYGSDCYKLIHHGPTQPEDAPALPGVRLH